MKLKQTLYVACTLAILALSPSVLAKTPPKKLSDEQIRKILIQQSIDAYPGNCPCPYNTMRNGRSCGGRSAYNRRGGYAPLCYNEDVTKSMVQAYRNRG
ncbi:hypothetical protein [Aquaspirillum soli]